MATYEKNVKSEEAVLPERINITRPSTVIGRAPKHQRAQVPFVNPRGTDNRLTGVITGGTNGREQNTEVGVKIVNNGEHFEFSGASTGQTALPQKRLDEVYEQYKKLRAQGRQPDVTITGLASGSRIPRKGGYKYSNDLANELSDELLKRGVPPSAISIEQMNGPEPDPRSISPKQKSLQRGAFIDVKRPNNDGFYDERTLGKASDKNWFDALGENRNWFKTFGDVVLAEFASAASQNPLSPFDMHDKYGRIGKLTVRLTDMFNVFYDEHVYLLSRVGLPVKDSNGKEHTNSFNGSFKNAFRHTFWQALGTYYLGFGVTSTVADFKDNIVLPPNIKENQSFRGPDGGSTLARADVIIDLLNNKTGRRIGSDNYDTSPKAVCLKVLEEALKNGLWVAGSIENLGSKTKPDFEVTIRKRQLTIIEYNDFSKQIEEFFNKPANYKITDTLDYDLDHRIGF